MYVRCWNWKDSRSGVPGAPVAINCWSEQWTMKNFMTPKETFLPTIIDIENLGLDAGAHLLIKHGLSSVPVGGEILVRGCAPGWGAQLSAWCRTQGHLVTFSNRQAQIPRSDIQAGRWRGALQTGHADPRQDGAVHERPLPCFGLAARGATVEAGAPEFSFRLDR